MYQEVQGVLEILNSEKVGAGEKFFRKFENSLRKMFLRAKLGRTTEGVYFILLVEVDNA